MRDVTESVNYVAEQVGASVDWASFRTHARSRPVMRLVMLAGVVAFADSIRQHLDEYIGEALDAAAGTAGTDDTSWPAMMFGVSVDHAGRAEAAMAEAQALLEELVQLGVLRPTEGQPPRHA